MVYQWVWRQSLGPASPFDFLHDLPGLLKHWRKRTMQSLISAVFSGPFWDKVQIWWRVRCGIISIKGHGRLSSVYQVVNSPSNELHMRSLRCCLSWWLLRAGVIPKKLPEWNANHCKPMTLAYIVLRITAINCMCPWPPSHESQLLIVTLVIVSPHSVGYPWLSELSHL